MYLYVKITNFDNIEFFLANNRTNRTFSNKKV